MSTVKKGIILKNEIVVIRRTMGRLMSEKLHQDHEIVEKTDRVAIDIISFPEMSVKILTQLKIVMWVINLSTKREKSLLKHKNPAGPWQKVGKDLFVYDGATYIIIVDHYRSYFEARK